jgi:hypothetical protein
MKPEQIGESDAIIRVSAEEVQEIAAMAIAAGNPKLAESFDELRQEMDEIPKSGIIGMPLRPLQRSRIGGFRIRTRADDLLTEEQGDELQAEIGQDFANGARARYQHAKRRSGR